MKVVIPDDIVGNYTESTEVERLREYATVEIYGKRIANSEDLRERVHDSDIILSFRPAFTKFPAAVIRECKKLRYICIAGAGVEDVDVAFASERGVAVGNVSHAGKRNIVEHCLALMFAVARRVAEQDRAVRSGTWQSLPGIELGGKTLGIIGLSAIACELAPLAKALGMNVISWSRNNDAARAAAVGSRAVPLEEVLSQADVVSLHLRFFPELRAFIGAKQFAMMKTRAIFINTARGELIDDIALASALSNRKLWGAGLDVFTDAPLPANHPFQKLENIVMTPVCAWNTVDSSLRMVRQSIDNVIAFIDGNPVDIKNAAALSRAPSLS